MMDRWLDGWRFGPERDNHAKLHPDLVGYDRLNETAQEKDRDFARWLDGWLERSGTGVRR